MPTSGHKKPMRTGGLTGGGFVIQAVKLQKKKKSKEARDKKNWVEGFQSL